MTTAAEKTAQRILGDLGQLRAGHLVAPIPHADLETLAREHLARSSPRVRLADAGQVYVSLSATREYMAWERITGEERARRELTELMLDAKESTTAPGRWRARRRATMLDVTAIVAREGALMVVTSIMVRSYDPPTGRRR